MPEVGPLFLSLALLAGGSILASAAGSRIGAPLLLIILVAGMIAGREGPGGIVFERSEAAFYWGSAAIAVILFEGGLRTDLRGMLQGMRPGLCLALGGTLLTALLVTPVASLVFDLDFTRALLLGAIVSSTDAAAVFALASSDVRLPSRVASTLEVESGFNDPIAIILVIGLVSTLAGDGMTWWQWILLPVYKLAAGGGLGFVVGLFAEVSFKRVTLPVGLKAILATSLGFVAFGAAEAVGASGFLAIYIAGVTMAARVPATARDAAPGVDGLAWLSQTGLFLMLGLYVAPSHLAAVAFPAFLAASALILLARPVATFVLLSPFRFSSAEMAFIAWTGLRGATPVFLGILPLLGGAPNAILYLSTATVVVLCSLIVQGWSAPLVARQMGLTGEAFHPPDRRDLVARLGAMSAALGVGIWFAVTLSPEELKLLAPQSTAELEQALKAKSGDPIRTPLVFASFPEDFSNAPVERRKALFIQVVALDMEQVNREIDADRALLRKILDKERSGTDLSVEEQAQKDRIARTYGGRYRQNDDLLSRVDRIPPSLAVAQAALATGWGSADALVARNAIFGRDKDGGRATVLDAVRDYARLINSHPDFSALRQERADRRRRGESVTGAALAPFIAPYAASGSNYAENVAAIIAENKLDQLGQESEHARLD